MPRLIALPEVAERDTAGDALASAEDRIDPEQEAPLGEVKHIAVGRPVRFAVHGIAFTHRHPLRFAV
jgi:hypothetical protein